MTTDEARLAREPLGYGVTTSIELLAADLAAARMRLRRGPADDRVAYELVLEPRSAYVLAGESRWKWEHHVPPAKELRYSITFRSLRARAQAPADP